ncbi:MAG: hypothetical protein AB3N13_16180 [Arenibacterium sp.]
MKPEWEDFKKTFDKKIKPGLKKLSFDKGWQVREKLISHLEEAWDNEDDLVDALENAHEDGVVGKKPEDFMAHAGFKKARGAWDKSVKAHKEQIKELSTYCGNAEKLHKDLKKILDPIQKDIKKNKPSRAEMKDFAKTLNEAEAAMQDLLMGSQIYGTLKMPERFYGAKEDATIAAVVKKKLKKISGKDLPKILEESVGKKNAKVALNMGHKVVTMCEKAEEEKEQDAKKAEKTMKGVEKQMKALKKLNDGYQEAAKKQAKDIEKATNAKQLKKIIEEINNYYIGAKEAVDDIRKKMKKKQPA